jgi:hypothetical protein
MSIDINEVCGCDRWKIIGSKQKLTRQASLSTNKEPRTGSTKSLEETLSSELE